MRSKLKTRYNIAVILGILDGIILAMGRAEPVFYLPGGILLVAILILSLTIRCPRCGKYLAGRRTWGIPHYCPNCGTAIRDGETEEE